MPETIVKHRDINGTWYKVDDVISAIKEAIDDETKDDIIGNLDKVFQLSIFKE